MVVLVGLTTPDTEYGKLVLLDVPPVVQLVTDLVVNSSSVSVPGLLPICPVPLELLEALAVILMVEFAAISQVPAVSSTLRMAAPDVTEAVEELFESTTIVGN